MTLLMFQTILCMLTISTNQLLPHLNRASTHGPKPDFRTEELNHADTPRLLHDADGLLHLHVLSLYERIILISFRINGSKYLKAFFPALLSSKPARRFREEQKSYK